MEMPRPDAAILARKALQKGLMSLLEGGEGEGIEGVQVGS